MILYNKSKPLKLQYGAKFGPQNLIENYYGGKLDEITIKANSKKYPNYKLLTNEERGLLHDKGPIGRGIRRKASASGNTRLSTDLKNNGITAAKYAGATVAGSALIAGGIAGGAALSPYLAMDAPILGQQFLTGSNLLQTGFATDFAVNRAPKIPGLVRKGKYGEAALETAMGALDLYGANIGKTAIGKAGKLIAKPIQEAGRYLTEETALRNAHKLNPYALKEAPLNTIYHNSNNTNLLIDDIDLFRTAKSQLKKKHVNLPEIEKPSGFYTTDNPNAVFMGGRNKYAMDIPANAKVYDMKASGRITDRISKKELLELQEKGYDIIKGKNMLGLDEFIPLNKAKLQNFRNLGERANANSTNAFDNGFFQTQTPHWLKGYPKSNFKSEIDWAKWNKEIPENKALMQEYNAIEQQAKANGTWMKNSDGTSFKGSDPTQKDIIDNPMMSDDMTPEEAIKAQFIQQRSQYHKNYYGKSALVDDRGNPIIGYHGTRTSDGINKNGFSSEMTGKGNRGAADGNFYFANNRENANYTGIGEDRNFKDVFENIQKVHTHFKSTDIPKTDALYKKIDALKARANTLENNSYGATTIFNKNKKAGFKKEAEQLNNEIKYIYSKDIPLSEKYHTGLRYMRGEDTGYITNPINLINDLPTSNNISQEAKDISLNAAYNSEGLRYSPQVIPSYINIENPSRSDWGFLPTDVNPLINSSKMDKMLYSETYAKPALDELSKPKYDGAIQKNLFDVLHGDVFIAKRPSQIKSALGNNGMFDITNPNIYKALAAPIGLGALYSQGNKRGGSIRRKGGILYNK